MAKHIKSLTSLRGVAALLVVMHHFFGYLLPRVGSTVSSYSKFFYNGYLGVDFFFILSGFIMTHVYANNFSSGVNSYNYRAYLSSRFARIYPLHIFMLFLFIGVELAKIAYLLCTNGFSFDFSTASFHPFTEKTNLTALFANIFLVQALDLSSPPLFGGNTYWNEPAWSISAEWIAYLLLPFLLFLLSKPNKFSASLVYISTLASLFFLIKLTYGHLDFLGLPSIVRCTLEGVLGIIIYQLYHSGTYEKYLGLGSTTITSVIWICIVMHYDWHDLLIIPAFCLLILSASINRNNGFISKILNLRFLVYLGAISYSIYMVHWFIQSIIQLVWRHIFQVEFGSNFNVNESVIALIICILLVLVTASWSYRFIELPMRKRLNGTLGDNHK